MPTVVMMEVDTEVDEEADKELDMDMGKEIGTYLAYLAYLTYLTFINKPHLPCNDSQRSYKSDVSSVVMFFFENRYTGNTQTN